MDESTAACEPQDIIEPPSQPGLLLDRTAPLLALFLLVGFIAFAGVFLTVFANTADAPRTPDEAYASTCRVLLQNGGSVRSNWVLSHWLNEGYFHYYGLLVRTPPGKVEIYRSSTGAYMLSGFILQKIYVAFSGHYSWRLTAVHNQLISLLLSALLGLLGFRISRRIGLDSRLAFGAGAAVVIVIFTFPDNLMLYWEMTPQAFFLVFAAIFLLAEERSIDGRRTAALSTVQAVAWFLMACMESVASLAFLSAMAVTLLVLEQRRGSWRRFFLLALLPCIAAFALYDLQLRFAAKRFPAVPVIGSTFLFRSGLDGESLYYGDHLDIALRRDAARNNWTVNKEYLFRWKWVFILGTVSMLTMVAAYVAGRIPRVVLEVLVWLTATWVVYAAVLSQSMVIHPYLYDVLLFAPLSIALFAFAPALGESLTRQTGAALMIAIFCAFWYALFQMRLYALRYPMPNTTPGTPVKQSILSIRPAATDLRSG